MLISLLSSCKELPFEQESPASPLTGDLRVAEVLKCLADFLADLAGLLLNRAFKPLLLSLVFQVAVAGSTFPHFLSLCRPPCFPLPYFVFVSHFTPQFRTLNLVCSVAKSEIDCRWRLLNNRPASCDQLKNQHDQRDNQQKVYQTASMPRSGPPTTERVVPTELSKAYILTIPF